MYESAAGFLVAEEGSYQCNKILREDRNTFSFRTGIFLPALSYIVSNRKYIAVFALDKR